MRLIKDIDASRRNVRNFGFLFGGIGLAIAGYLLWKGNPHWFWWVCGAAVFALSGMLARPIFRPIYIGWMAFAFGLGWVNTRLILGLFFYLVMTPIGLILRMKSNDPLERRIDRQATSYWSKKDSLPPDRERYERLF